MAGTLFLKYWQGIAAIFALAVSAYSIWNANRIHRKTSFINTVTAERVKWIEKVRDNISSFCGLARRWSRQEFSDEKRQEILTELDKLRWTIKLQLNPFNIDEKERYEKIVRLLDRIPELATSNAWKELRSAIEELIATSQSLLKEEWEKVKDEAEEGRLKREKTR